MNSPEEFPGDGPDISNVLEELRTIPFGCITPRAVDGLCELLDPEGGNDWRILADYLGYDFTATTHIKSVKSDKGSNTEILLQRYLYKVGSQPTIHSFREAIKMLNRVDVLTVLDRQIPSIIDGYKTGDHWQRYCREDSLDSGTSSMPATPTTPIQPTQNSVHTDNCPCRHTTDLNSRIALSLSSGDSIDRNVGSGSPTRKADSPLSKRYKRTSTSSQENYGLSKSPSTSSRDSQNSIESTHNDVTFSGQWSPQSGAMLSSNNPLLSQVEESMDVNYDSLPDANAVELHPPYIVNPLERTARFEEVCLRELEREQNPNIISYKPYFHNQRLNSYSTDHNHNRCKHAQVPGRCQNCKSNTLPKMKETCRDRLPIDTSPSRQCHSEGIIAPKEFRTAKRGTRVFITYVIDGNDTKRYVLSLIESLQKNEFNASLDIHDKNIEAPNKQHWINSRFAWSDFILVCITPQYKNVVERRMINPNSTEEFSPLHACALHDMMCREFRDNSNINKRFVPLLFPGATTLQHIPNWLQDSIRYAWPRGFQDLFMLLSMPHKSIKVSPISKRHKIKQEREIKQELA